MQGFRRHDGNDANDGGTVLPVLTVRPESSKLSGPHNTFTASFAALTGRALTIFRAGLALNIIGSPLNGFVPWRALVAGFLTTTNLAKPGTRNTPVFFSSL